MAWDAPTITAIAGGIASILTALAAGVIGWRNRRVDASEEDVETLKELLDYERRAGQRNFRIARHFFDMCFVILSEAKAARQVAQSLASIHDLEPVKWPGELPAIPDFEDVVPKINPPK